MDRARNEQEQWMELALHQAYLAQLEGEVPIGAVVVHPKRGVVGVGRNRREVGRNALAHAEMEAIHMACRTLGGWRLFDCDLYVTLEPCPMCSGAIINARIRRVYYGAHDVRFGAAGSLTNLFLMPFNHQPEVIAGVLEEPCRTMLTAFFRRMRNLRQKGIEIKRVQARHVPACMALIQHLPQVGQPCFQGKLFEGYTLAAFQGEEAVGILSMAADGTITMLYCREDVRRLGVGTALYLPMEYKARTTQKPAIAAAASEADAFLLAMGFCATQHGLWKRLDEAEGTLVNKYQIL